MISKYKKGFKGSGFKVQRLILNLNLGKHTEGYPLLGEAPNLKV